jgi:hypothetical protein
MLLPDSVIGILFLSSNGGFAMASVEEITNRK